MPLFLLCCLRALDVGEDDRGHPSRSDCKALLTRRRTSLSIHWYSHLLREQIGIAVFALKTDQLPATDFERLQPPPTDLAIENVNTHVA